MEEKIELMYKAPGASDHQNITEVLDEILLTLGELSERVKIVEEFCDQVAALENAKLDDELFGGTD